jgi:hypothetical protein
VPHLISESSRVDSPVPSPVPTVHRQGAPGAGSRLYEQFAASTGLPLSAVTRVDLHEDHVAAEDYEGYDRPKRSTSTRSNPLSYHTSASHQSLNSAGRPRHPHRRPQHPAFQVCLSWSAHHCYIRFDKFDLIGPPWRTHRS